MDFELKEGEFRVGDTFTWSTFIATVKRIWVDGLGASRLWKIELETVEYAQDEFPCVIYWDKEVDRWTTTYNLAVFRRWTQSFVLSDTGTYVIDNRAEVIDA